MHLPFGNDYLSNKQLEINECLALHPGGVRKSYICSPAQFAEATVLILLTSVADS
jgi:hypothetical protein